MSLLKKLFGHDVDKLVEDARGKEERGDLPGAIVDYERAVDGLEERDEARRKELSGKIAALRDRLADRFVAEAQEHIRDRELERASETLGLALEGCGTDGKREEIGRMIDSVALMIADAQVNQPASAMTEEEVYQALSGSWSQPQIDEFDGYGERFKKAYLQFHAGGLDEALAAYRDLLREAGEDALYLRLELARALHVKAHALAEDKAREEAASKLRAEAIETIKAFQKMLPRRRAPEVRAQAWSLLAQIHADMKNLEDAEDALMEAQNLLPEEPAVYLNLGRFLFEQGRVDDAICALEQGEKVMDGLHPNLDLLLLLGTAYRKAGSVGEAIKRHEAIVGYYVNVGRLEFDPPVARPLAEMLEETGRLLEASDIYRNLSTGGDADNLAIYNYHAARLMKKLGRKEEDLSPFILRAKEHAPDEELRKKIEDLEKG
jgi:tetratricopeptide (TPR) repeat protein